MQKGGKLQVLTLEQGNFNVDLATEGQQFGVVWRNVETIREQAVALRFVVLADRLYDKDVPILASGVPFDQLFTEEMMTGGYMKKYFRAVSRLTALAREGQNHEPS